MSRLPKAGSRMSPRPGWSLAFAFLATMLVLWLQGLLQGSATTETAPVSQFEQALAEGHITEVAISDQTLIGLLKEPIGQKTRWQAVRVEPDLAERMQVSQMRLAA